MFNSTRLRPGPRPNNPMPRFRPGATDTTAAPVLLGVGGSLMFLSIILLTARIWSRVRPVVRLHWDDWTAFAATVCFSQLSFRCSWLLEHGNIRNELN